MSSSMLRLLLIRHGMTEWNEAGRLMGRQPIPLAPRGEAQIRKLGAALADVHIDALFCSPQQRARETASIIAAPHGLEVAVEAALDEVLLGPRWLGKTFEDIRDDPDFVAFRDDPLYDCADIEHITKVQARVVELVDRLRAAGGDRTIALISHGDPLRALLSHLLRASLADYRRFVIETGSASLVVLRGDVPRVLLLSWRPGDRLEEVVSPREW